MEIAFTAVLCNERVMDRADSSNPEIKDLISRAQSGERSAFDCLMKMHERQVISTAWRLLGRAEDAEDAAQEVFLRLYRYLHKINDNKSLKPWLYRVTVNVSNDIRRRKYRNKMFMSVDNIEQLMETDEAPDQDQVVAARQEMQLVMEALNSLSKKQRTAVVLRDMEDLSTAEVAQILKSSETTVRSSISRARLKIRQFRNNRMGGAGR